MYYTMIHSFFAEISSGRIDVNVSKLSLDEFLKKILTAADHGAPAELAGRRLSPSSQKNWGGSVKGGSSDDARATRPRVLPIKDDSLDLILEWGRLEPKSSPNNHNVVF
jgi:hypothetical protein